MTARTILLAKPHGFCAGVRHALALADEALAALPPGETLYCYHDLVHNARAVGRLAARGLVFVKSLEEVPDGARLLFSAHGVAPAVRAEAARRGMRVTDATCGFVARLHEHARRYANTGFAIAFIGTRGHDETEGVAGEAPGRVVVVQDAAEAEALSPPPGARVAVLTQTSLAPQQAAPVVTTLRRRFPDLELPEQGGTCRAAAERQDAVRGLAAQVDLVIVLGSPTSANGRRLAEVARAAGVRAELLEDADAVRDFADAGGLDGVGSIGVTAAASTPEDIVDEVMALLRAQI